MGSALKRLLLALAAQIPVIGIAVTWWAEVLQHPVLSAGIAVVYESLVLGWSLLGKDVWKKLQPEIVDVTADWVKITALNALSGFRRRYNRQVAFEHRVFNVRGLRAKGGNTIEVEQVFVEVNIAPSNIQQASADPLAFKQLSGSRPVWDFLRRFNKQHASALAIIGPPGCGKTTLLQHIALTFATNRQRRYKMRAAVPLLLFLREHVKAIVEERLPLAELSQRHFADQARYPELDPPPKWFPR